jgi:hypothetical protein
VAVDEKLVGRIEQGLLVFLGVAHADNEKIADKLLNKILLYWKKLTVISCNILIKTFLGWAGRKPGHWKLNTKSKNT